MERSAVNSYSAAGASIGLAFGLYIADLLIGTSNPGFYYSLAAFIAMPFAAGAYLLVSRSFRRAGKRQQVLLAVSGWFVFCASVAVLFVAMNAIFPKAVVAQQFIPAEASGVA